VKFTACSDCPECQKKQNLVIREDERIKGVLDRITDCILQRFALLSRDGS